MLSYGASGVTLGEEGTSTSTTVWGTEEENIR